MPSPSLKSAPHGPLAPSIGRKLAAAENKLQHLVDERADVVLDRELGRAGAAERLAGLHREIETVRGDVAELSAAHERAQERDRQAEKEARQKLQAAQLAAFSSHARARHQAAEGLCAAIDAMATNYKRFVELSAKMAASLPVATAWPSGASAATISISVANREYSADIMALLAVELHRRSEGLSPPLPGSKPLGEEFRYMPEAVQALPDAVAKTNQWVTQHLKEQLASEAAR